ncbi:MAG: VOC family protein [Gammaproteobacteria bacterium]|nr:VOC family protein [Gammaproteobacteria bacterium]
MELGAFSISLSVSDLDASKSFYEKLGFRQTGGDGTGYLIMVNGTTIVGLFHGMFEENILTFNPGLAQDTSRVEDFTDVREIRAALVSAGVKIATDTDPEGTGPAHIVVVDPDGNPVLIDQFFPKPGTAAEAGCDAPESPDPPPV